MGIDLSHKSETYCYTAEKIFEYSNYFQETIWCLHWSYIRSNKNICKYWSSMICICFKLEILFIFMANKIIPSFQYFLLKFPTRTNIRQDPNVFNSLNRNIECFHSRGQQLCKFIGTKESVCIRKEFNSHGTGLRHQHGRRFIVLGQQDGRRDVMWKHSTESAATFSLFNSRLKAFLLSWFSTCKYYSLVATFCPLSEQESKKGRVQKSMRRPGIEPGSTAWKAAMLTTIPPTPVLSY